jgi:hypothetical protein
VPPPASTRYATLAELAGAYAAWDAFDLPEAHATLARLREMDAREQWAPDALARIEWQHAALARLNSAHVRLNDTPFAILANDPEAVLALLGSLYANALRREAQGRYDVAALLLYRCLELMSQRRLAGLGIDADAERITLMKGYGLLETRRDPLVWSPAGSAQGQPRLLDRIRATTAARNKSMLAHGFRLIRREQEYLPFRAVVDDVFDRFFAAEQVSVHLGLMRAAWHALFQAAEPE